MTFSEDHALAPTISTIPAASRLFVADDHEVVLAGLMSLLAAEPDIQVVGYATDGESVVEKIAYLHPPHCPESGVDIVIMDVQMSPMSGTQATLEVKCRWPQTKVLALSMYEARSYVQSIFEAGASGYVLKRSAAATLIRAVRAVRRGEVYLDPAFAPVLVTSLGRKSVRGEIFGARLSPREEEVLRLIAQGQSNKAIAARLDVSVKTIETHKARSTAKLGIDGRTEIMRYALEQGWLQSPS